MLVPQCLMSAGENGRFEPSGKRPSFPPGQVHPETDRKWNKGIGRSFDFQPHLRDISTALQWG